MVYWRPIGSRIWAFQRIYYWTPTIQYGGDPPSWKLAWRYFFLPWRSDLDRISQIGPEWHVDCGVIMVEIETRSRLPIGRLGKFIGMSSQSHVSHCRVLSTGEFNVMIPEPCATSQGATWRIQWHVILEPRATLQGAATWWIQCHDPIATCHIAGWKNSIRHIENRFAEFFLFSYALWALASGGFRIVFDILV